VAEFEFDEVEEAEDEAPEPSASIAEILDELAAEIEHAKSMPLSSSAIVSREDLLELINEGRAQLPAEIARARNVLRDHEELLTRAEREADEILDDARSQAAHIVQRTEIVRQARNAAERIIADAESEARRIQHEADDYVDRKLAAFEIVLDRTIRTVRAGRDRLTVIEEQEPEEQELQEEEGFFDQDRP
jgi:F0F1-type ATP synthase membrane subunit b/b'